MEKLPKKFSERVARSLRRYQAIAEDQRKRDVSEADTVTLIKDILADVFGYDKYAEISSEHLIRGTYCDLAVKVEGKIKLLIEVKGAGLDLNESHLRQTLNYGANLGVEWVVLTNGTEWQLHKVIFDQPVGREEVARFNLLGVSSQKQEDLKIMYLLAREGMASDAMQSFHQRAQLLNKFVIAQLIQSEVVVTSLRRELRKLFSDLKVTTEQIQELLSNEVLKREVLEGDKVKEAQARVKKAVARLARLAEKEQLAQLQRTGDGKVETPLS